MAPRGYASAADVLARLPAATPLQVEVLDATLEVVEGAIDAYTGRTWLATVTDEWHPEAGQFVFLRSAPVTSLALVTDRDGVPLAAEEYTLVDAARGRVSLWGGPYDAVRNYPSYDYWRGGLRATYVAGAPPAVVREAAIRATLGLLRTLGGVGATGSGEIDPTLVKSYTIGGEVSVTFRDLPTDAAAATTYADPLPADAKALLGAFRAPAYA